ncbi:MAG: gliding motility protein GldC [Flavobacteriales bacterium]|nr:gliding motility protein GldC [Flavobacteriales bacterium]
MKESHIQLRVVLDENKIPEKLFWKADNAESPDEKEMDAFFLSLWDKKENNSMRIDLWTKEMPVETMFQFFYQNLISMSETLHRATGEEEMSKHMEDFAEYFAEKTGIK